MTEAADGFRRAQNTVASGLIGPKAPARDKTHAQDIANQMLNQNKHFPNESLEKGFPPPEVNDQARIMKTGIPPIPDFSINSAHPGRYPPPGGPSPQGQVEFTADVTFPQRQMRSYAGFSAMLQTLSALHVLKQASSQAISVLRGNLTIRTRAEEALNEAAQMDIEAGTRNVLNSLKSQARNCSARSERFIHAMAMTVRQAELAVANMVEAMGTELSNDEQWKRHLVREMSNGYNRVEAEKRLDLSRFM